MVCGCLAAVLTGIVVLTIGVVILLPRLPGLALLAAGFSARGSTAQTFANAPLIPLIQLQEAVTPGQAAVNLGSYGTQELPTVYVQTGRADGAQAATVRLSEDDLMTLCRQRTTICSNNNPQYRNVRVDLRPGGGVVYADVSLPELGITQTVGAVLRLDATQRQFEISGVDVGGTLYALPGGTLGERVREAAATANALLQQASLNVDGGQYALTDIRVDETSIMFVMR
jgi:hypothetical protein